MTEPRLIRRTPKSGYSTRRSASESNSRSPMYFPEVDVDVRPRPRSDEPDFSHIKSTEDISSGYSSADNSVSLTRTASLGARARSRTTRTTVTTIKRPQAAEESEVIMEELRDDDGFEYTNMPSLVNLPAQIFMSHTDPPFLYQYIGDQVRIIQVLGENRLGANNNKNVDKDIFVDVTSDKFNNVDGNTTDQQETVKNEELLKTTSSKDSKETETSSDKNNANEMSDVVESNEVVTENDKCDNVDKLDDSKEKSEKQNETTKNDHIVTDVTDDNIKPELDAVENSTAKKPDHETISLVSLNEITSAESGDDEASFGTPDISPQSKRKIAKGKYGKGKAPPPPLVHTESAKSYFDKSDQTVCETTSQESLVDIVNRLPNTAFKKTENYKCLQIVNPMAENKRRHKSKSPGNVPKGNSTAIGRLLQLPSKLAFWSKTDDRSRSDVSESSDHSRRSSNIDQAIVDEFQSCADLTAIIPLYEKEKTDDQISFEDAVFDSEDITQDIKDKSDALQKLIEAKIESHPEYKIVALHAEIPTTSKSTDV